jgi:hypothetical protein
MNQTERIYQSKALTEGWGKIEIARPWWFDTSTTYPIVYTLDSKGTPIVWDDEGAEFTVEETRQCTGDNTCTIILAQNKKRALVMVNSKLENVKVLGSVEKDISWEDYTRVGLLAVKKHISGFALEAVIINPNIKTLEKFKVVKAIIKKVVEARDYIQGGNDEPANQENPKD